MGKLENWFGTTCFEVGELMLHVYVHEIEECDESTAIASMNNIIAVEKIVKPGVFSHAILVNVSDTKAFKRVDKQWVEVPIEKGSFNQ